MKESSNQATHNKGGFFSVLPKIQTSSGNRQLLLNR